MYVWYPAVPDKDKKRMQFRMYADFALEDFGGRNRAPSKSLTEQYNDLPFARSLTADALEQVLNSSVRAHLNLPVFSRRFPLLVLGQGLYYESPVTHAILCEYLASQGYIVVTCPLIGVDSRWVKLTPVDLEARIRDMELILSRARALPNVDADRIGAIGFDLGGMSGLVMAMRRSDIDAFLSLDCGILFDHGSGLPVIMPDYRVERFDIPWMHMVSRRHFDLTRGDGSIPSLFDRKTTSDNYLLIFDEAQHADFTSYAMIDGMHPVPTYWGPFQGDPSKRYSAVCRYARCFFDTYLNHDAESLRLLKASSEEIAPGVAIDVHMKRGDERAFLSADYWLESIFTDGIEKAVQTAKQHHETGASAFLFDERILNQLGYKFLYNWVDLEKAVEIFRLNVYIHPESSNVYDSLGEAFLAQGDRAMAIENYKKSLELNPENENAKRTLKSLGVVIR